MTLSLEYPSGGGGEGGDDPVDPTSLDYKIANRLQLTDAPTIYIDLPDIGTKSLDNYLYKIGGKGTKEDDAPYRRASIKVVATDDTTSPHYMESFEVDADHLEIKARGNSTSLQGVTDAKRAYRLKFAKKDKTTGIDYKHDMTNAGYSKRNWTLLANVFDHSLIRNAVTCELGKIVGMPFNPTYKFVDLVINNEYRGTYQVSDHCEADKNRININEDTGWYVEFQGRTDMTDFPMCFADGGLIMNISNPEPAYTGTETNRADSAAVENVLINEVKNWFKTEWASGFAQGFTSPTTGWRAYNDEETLMKFWLMTEITGDYDGLMTVKAYREADGKLCWGPIWDKDLAYGNYSSMSAADGNLVKDLSGNGSSVQGYFINNFAKDPAFMAKVKAKMDELVAGGLKTTLCEKIDELATIVAQTEALNEERWGFTRVSGGVEQYHGGVSGYDKYAAYIAQLKDWINARVDYVQTQINALYTAANTPEEFEYDVTTTSSESISNKMDKLVNVTMKNRTFTANAWNTISLPFSVTETQLTSIFGEGYELKEFSGIDETDNTKLLFTTPEDNAIQAGIPYLIKPTQAVVTSPVFNGVTIAATAKGWKDSFYYGGEKVAFDNGNYEFISHLVIDYAADRKAIGADATLTNTNNQEKNIGSQAFIRILNSAPVPTIVFPSDVEPVVRTQLTNLPTIYIDTKDGAEIQPSTGDYVQAAIQVIDDPTTGHLTSFTESEEYLQIRGRGKAEWKVANGKKSYRLKFAKQHKYDLTGAGYTKRNWILAANAADESMIKNALTKKLGDAVGLPFTPNTCFVDLVVNGKYLGTYTAMDYVEADRENGTSKRVNADEKTGRLIEMMNESGVDTSGDVYVAGTNYTRPWVIVKNPEPDYKKTDTDEVKNAAISAVTNPVQTFIDNLWKSPETYVDKTTLVNWYIASEILGGTTTLSSVYAYKDVEDTQLKFGPLWGSELAWQNSAMTDDDNNGTKNGLIVNSAAESALRNLLQSLWNKSWFTSLVASRWLVVKNGLADALKTEADKLKSTISNSWTKNYTTTESDGAGWTATGTLEDDVNTIKTYIDNRIAYLDKKFLLAASDLEYDVTLEDALTAYAGFNNRTVNVTLKNRGTIWGGEWNSICLPFSLTNEQLIAVFDEGYELKSFKSVTEGETYNTFNFNDTQTTLDAGVPYIIKPQADVTNLTFNNVTLNLSLDNSVVEKNTFKFTGTLQPYKMADDGTDWFIGRNNKAYKSNGTLHACRAYFTMPSTQAAAKAFMFGNLITSIDNIVINDNSLENVKIYNLNGQVVGNSWNAVPQGIYIVNGKKVIK